MKPSGHHVEHNLFKEWKRIESKHGDHAQDHNVYMDLKRIGW
jgi:hypothetical protein